ncbi:cerebral cavernous malformations protein 2 homolog [Anneissia japonica]|uniref:cerebral cavernous malformations protein 2 homolog n=1 Tax=Anneissia japonica TaxID=1529436 RepID=UPI0014258EE5|nr:cerebral cavernous malformations protein 2 homolog [Anneissia japonica]
MGMEEPSRKKGSKKQPVIKGLLPSASATLQETDLSDSAERRRLHTTVLNPPEYRIDAAILIDSYTELEVKYLGVITDVPHNLDASKRVGLLHYVDKGRREHKLARRTKDKSLDAVVSLSVRQLKITRRDGEEPLERLAIHNIAAVSHIRDDAEHFVLLKTASSENQPVTCNLVVLLSPNKEQAEQLCSLVHQIFDIVYTELTMKYFDFSLIDVGKPHSTSGRSRGSPAAVDVPSPAIPIYPSHPVTNEHDFSKTVTLLLKEYIAVLRSKLNAEELQQFASILREYRQHVSIEEFCQRLHHLYGDKRMYLFPGLRPFIPERDSDSFEEFLDKHVLGGANGDGIYSGTAGRRKMRTLSDGSSSTILADNGPYTQSIPSEMDELDRALQDAFNDVTQLENSIDDS